MNRDLQQPALQNLAEGVACRKAQQDFGMSRCLGIPAAFILPNQGRRLIDGIRTGFEQKRFGGFFAQGRLKFQHLWIVFGADDRWGCLEFMRDDPLSAVANGTGAVLNDLSWLMQNV